MGKTEKNIKEMRNIEIKENILLINKRQLQNIEKASFLNIFNSIIGVGKLLEEQKNFEKIKNTKELDIFYSKWESAINTIILFMEEKSNIDKEKTKKDLKKNRKEIYNIALILEGYIIELSYIGDLIDEYGVKLLSKEKYKNIPYDNRRIDELITRIEKTLDENKENYESYIYIISEIISILPMRLVKDNYYNIIKNSLIRNFKNHNKFEVENQIDNYKKQFDSSSRDGYGTKFDIYFTEIQKLKNLDLKDKKLEELSKLIKQNTELSKNINELININFILGLISNMNIVIALTNEDAVKSEIETNYFQWRNILENNDEKEIKKYEKAIEKEIKKVEQDILKDIDKYEKLNIEALNREDFEYETLKEELTKTKKILTYYNDSQFENYNIMFPENDEVVTNEYLEQSIDSLNQYMNRSIKNMNNFERRIRMRNLLSKIDLPFSGINNFTEYIRYGLNNKIITDDEINFKIDHINFFLENFTK